MTKLQAKSRLVAAAIARVVTATNIPWDKTFKKTFTGSPSTGTYGLKTKEGGHAQVRIMIDSEDETPDSKKLREMDQKYGGNLMDGVPNIELKIAGKDIALTWEEAYNLGFMLMKNAESAYYG